MVYSGDGSCKVVREVNSPSLRLKDLFLVDKDMVTMTHRRALHKRLKQQKGRARDYKCHDCEKQALDWSNVSHEYIDIDDFVPRCRSCHTRYDGKVVNLKGKHRPKGFPVSAETRAKLSKALMGNQHVLGNHFRLGAILSKETREKIARAHQGRTHTEEQKRKISESMKLARAKVFWSTHKKDKA